MRQAKIRQFEADVSGSRASEGQDIVRLDVGMNSVHVNGPLCIYISPLAMHLRCR
jgi:hypothetical protein